MNITVLKMKTGQSYLDEAKVNICTLVYKRLNGNCPFYMKELLRVNSDNHTRASRYGSLNLVCPRFKRETEGGRRFCI